MIKEVVGDILKSKAHTLVHGVAPNDNFHQGLALALRERWPSLYKDFRHFCQSKHPRSGELWVWKGAESWRIISLFTQVAAYDQGSHPGKATIENVNHCLRALRKELEAHPVESLAMTKLATGVGGLKWEHVKPLIYNHLGDLKIPIFLYSTYQVGVEAKEAA